MRRLFPRALVRPQPLAAKVPEITAVFWILKVLTTGMGESMSDFLAHVSVPLAGAVGLLGLGVATRLQFGTRTYRAPVYWFAVMMVAVFGTMVADGIRLGLHAPYAVTTALYAAGVAVVFGIWYRREGTLSIHSITTQGREAFYWIAVLGTFALGTAAGDLTAWQLHLGYAVSIVLFAAAIAIPAIGWWRFHLNPIVAFWAAYIVTRPLGASIADWLGKPTGARVHAGGLGVGDGTISLIALVAFIVLVAYITVRAPSGQRRTVGKPRSQRRSTQVEASVEGSAP